MNLKSQQLRSDLSLEIDYDQVLTPAQIKEKLKAILGEKIVLKKLLARKKYLFTTTKVILNKFY